MLVYRRDGFGGARYYPESSEMTIICTYVVSGHRYVIIQYLELPFCYRMIKRKGISLIDEKAHHYLMPYLDCIDEGMYDDAELAENIHNLMS